MDNKGFTLLEVMVAVAILATAMVVLLEAHAAAVRSSGAARRLSVASALARDVMTEFELRGYPEPGSEQGDFESWYPSLYPDYQWELEVLESNFWQNVREVYVKVYWMDGDQQRQVEVANFIAAMTEEEQEIAQAESSGNQVTTEEGMLNAYNAAAAGTQGAPQ